MRGLPLRVRLTAMVTLVFGLALLLLAVLGVNRMQAALRADTERNAEAQLVDYFDDLAAGQFTSALSPREAAMRFEYLSVDGEVLAPDEFDDLVASEITALMEAGIVPNEGAATFFGPPLEMFTVFTGAGDVMSFELFRSVGPVQQIDRGGDVISIGAPIQLGDRELTVAVSSPLQPVRNSIDRLRDLLFVAVPLLIIAIAVATWLIVGRALRPVQVMTAQVDRITSESLDQRLPLPAGRDELSHLATTMNRMLARLQSSRDAQRQFISDASHELRSPITATKATLEVARSGVGEVDWHATSDVLHDETERLAGLVDDLLLSAQLDEADLSANKSAIDLDEVCMSEAKRPQPCPVSVRIESPARVFGNLDHVTRAVRNVVDNAARHADTNVGIVVRSTDDFGIVEVLDDGHGIAPEMLESIFERFTRLDQSRQRDRDGEHARAGGAGLGLAITRQICDAHGGSVEASNRDHSEGATGARFTLRFPRLPATPAAP